MLKLDFENRVVTIPTTVCLAVVAFSASEISAQSSVLRLIAVVVMIAAVAVFFGLLVAMAYRAFRDHPSPMRASKVRQSRVEGRMGVKLRLPASSTSTKHTRSIRSSPKAPLKRSNRAARAPSPAPRPKSATSRART